MPEVYVYSPHPFSCRHGQSRRIKFRYTFLLDAELRHCSAPRPHAWVDQPHMLLAYFAVGLVSGFAPSPRNRAEPRAVSRFARRAVCKPRASPRLCSADEASKNMLWDTIDKEERPRLVDALEGRDYLTSLFLTHGVFVGGLNIVGAYGELRGPNPNPNPDPNPDPNPNPYPYPHPNPSQARAMPSKPSASPRCWAF